MKCNEDKSKKLLAEAGVPIPSGLLVRPGQEIAPVFPLPWILKAQVLSGGRGKAGGIRRVTTQKEAKSELKALFSLRIQGEAVRLVRIEPQITFSRELYLSVALNRQRKNFCLTAGQTGGVDIESCPSENLFVEEVGSGGDLAAYQIRNLFFHLRLPMTLYESFSRLLNSLFATCLRHRLLLAEINPLVLTEDGTLLALDGKVEIDDHRLRIDPELNRFFEPEHLGTEELCAREAGFSYHELDGFVGLLVNGAGLAMASMDILSAGGLPAANFLDLGGGADTTVMHTALDILFQSRRVKMIFINIFGGILSCSHVAASLRDALDNRLPPKPIVVRFAGNEADKGLEILRTTDLPGIYVAANLPAALAQLTTLRGGPQNLPRPATQFPAPRLISRTETSKPFPLPPDCRILIQGITGKQGQLHCRLMQEYGSRIVAGVTPGKGGSTISGVPVFDTIRSAVASTDIDASIIFVPGALAPDAVLEAAAAGIGWVVCITDGIPQQDMLYVLTRLKQSPTRVIGPNCPGLILPGRTKIGIMPGQIFMPGPVAVFSRSGTLTYECVDRLTRAGIGQSLCVGIGGDPFVGTSFTHLCQLVRFDPATRAVVILGEIGGQAEEELGLYMQESGFELPVFGFIAGRTAPPGKRLGHAGAILEKGGGIEAKLRAMSNAGFHLIDDLDHLAEAVGAVL